MAICDIMKHSFQHRVLSFSLLILLVLLTSEVVSAASSSEKAFNKAVKAINKEKYDEAQQLLTTAASENHAPSIYLLGAMMLDNRDYAKAEQLLSQAVAAGVEQAKLPLANLYMNGAYDFAKNVDKARRLYLSIADTSDPDALYQQALCYDKGYCDTSVDTSRALELYDKAARNGSTDACSALAKSYTEQGQKSKALDYMSMAREYNFNKMNQFNRRDNHSNVKNAVASLLK